MFEEIMFPCFFRLPLLDGSSIEHYPIHVTIRSQRTVIYYSGSLYPSDRPRGSSAHELQSLLPVRDAGENGARRLLLLLLLL
jgi:hypothetical protein